VQVSPSQGRKRSGERGREETEKKEVRMKKREGNK
jgi:hypothetical protein